MLIWDDVRLPPVYSDHYQTTGRCLNCDKALNDEVHALHHWALCHTVKDIESPRRRRRSMKRTLIQYWGWSPNRQKWQSVSEDVYLALKRDGFCTARTHRLPRLSVLRDKAA